MRTLLSKVFSRQGFRGPVLTLLSGSSVALLIAFLAEPILSRLYTPAQFGVYGYFASVMAVLITFTSLRYEDALMIPKEDKEAGAIVWLGLLLLGFFALLTGVLSIWSGPIARLANKPDVAPYLWLVPIALLAMRGGKLAELWLTRKRRFPTISAAHLSNTTAMVSSRIAVGVPPISAGRAGLFPGTSALIGGYILGNLVQCLVTGITVIRRSGTVLRSAFSWRAIGAAARRFRRYPLFSTPATLIAALVNRLPFFVIPLFFVAQQADLVGFYQKAFACVAVPFAYFSRAVAQVFFVNAVEAQAEGKLDTTTEAVHGRLVMVLLFPALLILVGGPDIFVFVLGNQWHEAGVFAQYLVPWMFLGAVTSPLTRLFDVMQRQRLEFLFGTLSLVLIATSAWIGGRTGSVQWFLISLCAGGSLARLAQLVLFAHLARVPTVKMLLPYGRFLLFALPGLALVVGALQLNQASLTFLASILAGAAYGGLLLWRKKLFQ